MTDNPTANDIALLREAFAELEHCSVFIRTRERMHPVGVGLFDEVVEKLRAALAPGQHDGAAGYVLVPREPTEAMLNAAVDLTNAGSGMSWVNRSPQKLFRQAWTAMLHAAATPSGADALGDRL